MRLLKENLKVLELSIGNLSLKCYREPTFSDSSSHTLKTALLLVYQMLYKKYRPQIPKNWGEQ